MQYIDMVLFCENLQFQHGVAPRGKDLPGGSVVAIGNNKGIAGGKQAFGYVAKGAALYLEHD